MASSSGNCSARSSWRKRHVAGPAGSRARATDRPDGRASGRSRRSPSRSAKRPDRRPPRHPRSQGVRGGDASRMARMPRSGGAASIACGLLASMQRLGVRLPRSSVATGVPPSSRPRRSSDAAKSLAAQPAAQLGALRLAHGQRCSTGTGSGASSRSVTSSREMRAFSACSISMSRRLDGFIAGAAASTVSRSPNSSISCAALFGPMPGTPGTLSIESPISAWTSISLSGRDAELLHHLGRADRLLLDRVQHLHAGPDQLHQVLVGGDDGDLAAGLRRPRGSRPRSGRRPPSRPARSAGTPNASVASRTRANCGISSSGGGGRCRLVRVVEPVAERRRGRRRRSRRDGVPT